VQIAKALGSEVTGVCSTAKVDMVRSIGADHVIDYTRGDIADAARRHDLILAIGGNRPLAHLRRALTHQGTLVIVGGEGGGRWIGGTVAGELRALAISPFVRQRLRMVSAKVRYEDLQVLTAFIEAAKICPTRAWATSSSPRRPVRGGPLRSRNGGHGTRGRERHQHGHLRGWLAPVLGTACAPLVRLSAQKRWGRPPKYCGERVKGLEPSASCLGSRRSYRIRFV
jgi:hypothetical protein